MIFVETNRLFLRKVEEGDWPYFRVHLTDREKDRMMLRSPCITEEDARLGFDWFLNKEERAYVIVLKETGDVTGNLTVYNNVPESVAAQKSVKGKCGKSLSFAMAEPWRRKGIMHEALNAVIEHLFNAENADYINSGCAAYNLPSMALHEKLGFLPILTERFSFNGQDVEVVETILWRTESCRNNADCNKND